MKADTSLDLTSPTETGRGGAAVPVLRTERLTAWFLLFSIGLVLAAVATPIRPPVGLDLAIQRPCDLGRRWFATFPEITALTDVTMNIGIYLPAGVAIAMLPISRRSAVAVAGVIALPAFVEALHYGVPVLGRGCQSADAIDSLTGLAIGLLAGGAVRLVRRAWAGLRARTRR